MKVSLSVVEKLVGFELPPIDELVERVNSQLGGVEEIIDLGMKYKDAKIAKVIECEKHPNADKLSVCKIDVGEDELVQVVCGAPNAHAGMWAVWLPPEGVVPATFDDKEPFVLGARELRGVMSHGMLASAEELAIDSDHSGIVDITKRDLRQDVILQPGASFAKTFGLDGYVIDIENKMFTHRPDLFGQLGVAREIAGIFGKKFTSPDWYSLLPEFSGGSSLALDVSVDDSKNIPRFVAVVMEGVKIGPSPLWLQCQLVAMGSKSINNVVDVTNYAMLMTAQPTHAYDYDKLRGHKIGARMAKQGEKITLLNDKTYELTPDDIVIIDGEGAIGLGGVMGGLDSEVTSETKSIVLEVATFDMYAIRKTSMRHGIFTDAVTRFNKGQSQMQNDRVMELLVGIIGDTAGVEQTSKVFDIVSDSNFHDNYFGSVNSAHQDRALKISTEFINTRLGSNLSHQQIKEMLENVEFFVSGSEVNIAVSIPFWRTDIELPEDIVEEVGRLYGFDQLPRELPSRTTSPAPKNITREVKQKIRESLSRCGANEVLTYSFVHENILRKSDQDVKQAFKLSNALSPDLQYYRLSVLPSLLDKVHANIKAGHDEFVLFEIGKGHNKKYNANDDGLPKELNFVDAVYASKRPKQGAPYYHVRRLIQQLCTDYGFTLVYKPVVSELDSPVAAPFEPSRSALLETSDGVFVGMIGELKQGVLRQFKLPEYTAAMTLCPKGLEEVLVQNRQTYRPLSRYPSVTQDVSLTVPSDTAYETVFRSAYGIASEEGLDVRVVPVSIYQPEENSTTKTITLRLTFMSYDKTLSDKNIAPIMRRIEQKYDS